MFLRTIREKRSLRINGIATKCTSLGVTGKKRNQEVIVSLTSHPGRIHAVHKTIITLLNQTVKPDRVILWLAQEQFPNSNQDLPNKLLVLQKYGLEIRWCEDIRSYKKLIPTMELFPNAVIITVDDDWYYRSNLVEELLKEHEKYPEDIISSYITRATFNEHGEPIKTGESHDFLGTASFLNKILGGTGVLFPSNSLHPEAFNRDAFMELAPTNDDIWFWSMAVKNHVKIRVPKKPIDLYAMTDSENQLNTSLGVINEAGNCYIKCTKAIFERYPDVFEILKYDL